VLRLHVTRSAITLQAPEGASETTRAVVAVGIEGFRTGIISVGEDEAALARRLAQRPAGTQHKWLARKILKAAETRGSDTTPKTEPRMQFVRPGADPFWDAKWQDFKQLEHVDLGRPDTSQQVLLVDPLGADTWSPHLTRGVVMYALWTSTFTAHKVWPPFRRPRLELHVAADFSDLEYAELVDQLRSLWGQKRVVVPPDRQVSPRPLTALAAGYAATRIAVWAALLLALFTSLRADGSTFTLVAVGIAGLALMIGRKLKGLTVYELPRRANTARPEPITEPK
jgi:hypothetical protein